MWFFPQNGVCAGYHAVVGLWRLLGWGGSYLSRFCAEGLEEAWQRACPAVLSLPVPCGRPFCCPPGSPAEALVFCGGGGL